MSVPGPATSYHPQQFHPEEALFRINSKATMPTDISINLVPARTLAAVRRKIRIDQIAAAWKLALDQVWAFLQHHPGLRADSHNVFLYHHPGNMRSPMDVDFGVEVTRSFEPSGEVFATETPAGKVATAVHSGPYERLGETHAKIHAWAAANSAFFAGQSWEIYGDWTSDTTKLETRVEYLLL
jgi:effector-binding domain-containing protein